MSSNVIKRTVAGGVLAAVMAGTSLVNAPTASAAAPSSARMEAYYVAYKKIGKPYVYGADGPNSFDCSGLTQWSYKNLKYYNDRKLKRTANAQYRQSKHISKSNRTKGDLIFFDWNGDGSMDHVGIYAGYNKILHAPRTGQNVKIEKIWTSKGKYGRIN